MKLFIELNIKSAHSNSLHSALDESLVDQLKLVLRYIEYDARAGHFVKFMQDKDH